MPQGDWGSSSLWASGVKVSGQQRTMACVMLPAWAWAIYRAPSIPTEITLPKKQERKAVIVSSEFVDEALSACEEHLSSMAHKDIDKDPDAPLYFSPEGWSDFLQRYYQIVQ